MLSGEQERCKCNNYALWFCVISIKILNIYIKGQIDKDFISNVKYCPAFPSWKKSYVEIDVSVVWQWLQRNISGYFIWSTAISVNNKNQMKKDIIKNNHLK